MNVITWMVYMAQEKIYSAESHIRTLIKSVSWRVLGTLTTMVVTFSITNSLSVATAVGVIELLAKVVLFYLHERIWIKINNATQ